MLRKMAKFLVLAVACIGMWATVSWAGVSVYAEGAYTDDNLVVYIYVDVDTDPILSYGVKLIYNPSDLGSPPDFSSPVVEKNNGDWYFGDKTSPYPTPNADPDTTTPGEIVIVGGKLDSASPQAGVTGDRVLLAKVTFSRLNANIPSAELYLGRGGEFSNFVRVNGDDLDKALAGEDEIDPIGQVEIHERGDANGDGNINSIDAQFVSQVFFGLLSPNLWADCNGDGSINSLDAQCISQKFFGLY